ncbi:MAG TPA: hypothetical protein VHN80_06585, partial [Kineosporiaceae bacterium]|nr:hypothetical protein [Kineosporiaceae bacterium]
MSSWWRRDGAGSGRARQPLLGAVVAVGRVRLVPRVAADGVGSGPSRLCAGFGTAVGEADADADADADTVGEADELAEPDEVASTA